MDKVYVVLAGEEYEGSSIVSIHATVVSAVAAAMRYTKVAAEVDGIQFKQASASSWKAKSGHYVEVAPHQLVG